MTEEIKLYTLKDLETILGVSYITLLRYVKAGKIKAVKCGREWKVTEENLKNFLNGN